MLSFLWNHREFFLGLIVGVALMLVYMRKKAGGAAQLQALSDSLAKEVNTLADKARQQ